MPTASAAQVAAVSTAARGIDELRNGWLAIDESRTITALYNEMPQWLVNAHATLDAVVLDTYGFGEAATTEQILGGLLRMNLARPGAPARGSSR
jgi:hypothetical protein